jgi:hypothetical protein
MRLKAHDPRNKTDMSSEAAGGQYVPTGWNMAGSKNGSGGEGEYRLFGAGEHSNPAARAGTSFTSAVENHAF